MSTTSPTTSNAAPPVRLTTRCPACATKFHVVSDQLRISEGWVRCGRCQEVFNAEQSLVTDPPAPPAPASEATSGSHHASDEAQHTSSSPRPPAPDADAPAAHSPAPDAAAPLPSFVRHAQRKAWWARPGVRFVMGMMVMLLPFFLLLQIALHERSTIAAWRPQWRPALEVMCVSLGCSVPPYRNIAALVVTGSDFRERSAPAPGPQSANNAHGNEATHYELEVSIRNDSALHVATPAVELTLKDEAERTLVRKVLRPATLGAPPELTPGQEWSGSLRLRAQDLDPTPAGYSVLLFYP